MVDSPDSRQYIRDFLAAHTHALPPADGDDLFTSGRFNSLFAMRLVLLVEEKFGITVEGDDLSIGNFNTIAAIMDLIQRKTSTVDVTSDVSAGP